MIMAKHIFVLLLSFVFLFGHSSSESAANVLRIDASVVEGMAKMMLQQFSSYLSPKNMPTKLSSDSPTVPKPKKPPTTTTPASEKIRQCTCTESDDCVVEAYQSFSACQLSCKSHLEYYGSKSEAFVECFPKNPALYVLLNQCLKDNLPQFCVADGHRLSFIKAPNYNQTSTMDFNMELGIKALDMIILEHLKAFHLCSGACMKEKIIACYSKKKCGVLLPPNHDLGNIAHFCPDLKSFIDSNTMKAVPCFAMQQMLTKFVPH